jgi:FkbH-like protein
MLLVGLSKNNPDAIDVFSRHPGMALKGDDFVATAVNWEPKPDNIRRIASDLGLGLESFVFLDDSPHEREAMRRMCPGVIVPELPADPSRRPLWLRALACTWPLRLTEEDFRRSDMYVAERKGRELKEASGSYEAYLAGLDQRLVVAPVTSETVARAAQLLQRTNQFNLTTRRLTESELGEFMIGGRSAISLIGRVSDRFGDHGIVLTACATIIGSAARIETFVMSCRVIGRQLEQAFLDALTDRLSELGVDRVEASYRPTAKNWIVREFYPSMGFVAAGKDGDAELWVLSKAKGAAPVVRPVTTEWSEK